MVNSVFDRIQKFNQGRDPQRLSLKYQKMAMNSFVFYRGTCHLFYEDWPQNHLLNHAPPVWICGDLHLENFGSFKGDNGLVYFDMSDFDEGVLAPATWELARFLTSILVGANTLGVNQPEAIALCYCFLNAYIDALALGKARSVETETSEGMVKELLESLKKRNNQDFLDRRTEEKKGKRRFIIDNEHTASVTLEERKKVESFVENWASQQPNPQYFKVLDVGTRIAGTGSLGIKRYVILVEGKGSPDNNYLLDLKQASLSALMPYLQLDQPKWTTEAERVVNLQKRMQATPQAMLSAVMMDGESFVLRRLQSTEDRVSLDEWNGKLRRLQKVLTTMGEIVAWNQLRSGGRQGSAIADQLIDWAANASQWRIHLLEYAQAYSQQVETDYKEFCSALMQQSKPTKEKTKTK